MVGRDREVSNEDILAEFFLGDDPAMFAKEVAEKLEMSRQGIHKRLEELEASCLVNSKKPGRDRVYWLTEEGRERAADHLRG